MSLLPAPKRDEPNERRRPSRHTGTPIWATACALTLLGAILVAHPYAEVGISDDFSYIRIAQIVAQTGHIAYTGWVTPILGWQLYLAAGFIKLFGFSFTAARASVILVSVVTAFLCQRTFVRAGVNEWNASIGTLTLMLSPLLMPLEYAYMTDIPGLFATILCLYACIRAVQSVTERGAIGWIAFAAFSNVLFGSSRQIAWLGVLVMVPSALWLLRRRRHVVRIGGGLWVLSAALIFSINRWFEQQPYTQTEQLLAHRIGWHFLSHLSDQIVRASLEMVMLLLPILLMFLPALWRKNFPWLVKLAVVIIFLSGLRLLWFHRVDLWFAPYLDGVKPFIYPRYGRPVITVMAILCMLGLLTAFLTREERFVPAKVESPCLPTRTIEILLLPFVVGYLGLLSSRAGFEGLWDRYLIPLLFVAIIFIFRFYQQRMGARLPVAALVLALGIGAYAVAVSHDRMAMYRARAAALNEVLATGRAATSVSGGWDYDGWTELQHSSHIINRRMRVPVGVTLPAATHYGLAVCPWFYCNMYPHVVPQYTISLRDDPIPGNPFPTAPYKTWILPAGRVYVVRFPDRSVDGRVR